jgi:hypothetical protein
MVMRLMRRFWWSGQSGVAATMATQFGFAMMPLCFASAPELISGTTSGTSVFMRNAEELSTTTAPARTAAGAKRFDCAPPAENSAMSTPSRLASVSSCTATSPPRNSSICRPNARGQQAQFDQREFALLEALHELDADGAGGTGNGDDGILEIAFGLIARGHVQFLRYKKKPRVLRGALGSFDRFDYAQESRAPTGLVFVPFFVIVRIMGGER